MLRRLVVFGSTAELPTPGEQATAHRVAQLLGERSITLVTDGRDLGVNATVADTLAAAGGKLIGVTVEGEELAREEFAERRRVGSREEWQKVTGGLADGWLGLPAGFATLEDAFEVWGWNPFADQPLGLLDEGGYYSELLRSASDPTVDRFVLESQRGRLVVARDADDLLRRLAEYRSPETRRDSPFEE